MIKLHKTDPIWISLTVLALAILAACIGNTPVVPVDTQAPPPPPTSVSQNPTPGSQNPGTAPQPPVPPPPTEDDLVHMIKATVKIYGLFMENGKLTPKDQGAGTLISSTGLILTNTRIANPAAQGNPDLEPDKLAILLIDQEDQPPVPLYYAEVKAVDGYLDLAVLQITSTLDGAAVDPNSLNLPFVQLGNSDDLFVGQHINIFGYPELGGETITFTTGYVAGFMAEEGLGNRAWIKTDAYITSGNSGGLGADDAGFIIGIPSIVGSGSTNEPMDCRHVQDTNGDGVIDAKDICIPWDYLSGLRPVNLALPLITAVQTGQTYVSPFPVPTPAPTQNSPTPTPGG